MKKAKAAAFTDCVTNTPAPLNLPSPLAAETLELERTLSDLVNQAYRPG